MTPAAEAEAFPAAPMVNASRFRAAHEADWQRLEQLLTRMEKRSVRALDDDDILALPLLYRSTLSTLSVARETSLDRALVTYLEQLCTRAYFQLYSVPTSLGGQLGRFLATGWPLAVQALWKEILFCAVLLAVGVAAGFLLVRGDPSWFYSIIPESTASGRDPSASVDVLRDTIYDRETILGNKNMLATFAAFLFTHNSQVSIFAFALGFAFAVPTLLLILYNGLTMGAMLALFFDKGLGFGFTGWLMIHGTTELFAVVIAGAAGLRIGTAVAFPGRLARTESAVRAGRGTAVAMMGVICMLMVAGLLEGIGRQTVQSDVLRYSIGAAALVGWLCYFFLPRRREDADALAAR